MRLSAPAVPTPVATRVLNAFSPFNVRNFGTPFHTGLQLGTGPAGTQGRVRLHNGAPVPVVLYLRTLLLRPVAATEFRMEAATRAADLTVGQIVFRLNPTVDEATGVTVSSEFGSGPLAGATIRAEANELVAVEVNAILHTDDTFDVAVVTPDTDFHIYMQWEEAPI